MIEIRDVETEYSYGDSFSFSRLGFERGKVTSIIGRNGSGKSTLLKILCGLRPYTGSIRIEGKELRNIPTKERAQKLAYLPQNLKSINIDVETLVSHGRYPWHGSLRRMTDKDRKLIDKALDETRMSGFRNRNLQELSGGERQRAYLAMVIAQDAPMILLDEPTTYMDMTARNVFYDIIRSLTAEGRGIVMVCHDIEQSLAYSDSLCLLNERTVAAQCTPDEMVDRTELFRKVFGTSFKKSEDKELLYPYVAVKI